MSKFRLIRKHGCRNSILPIITRSRAADRHPMFSGAFVIERIFAIPGLGSYLFLPLRTGTTMVMGRTIFIAALYVLSF